MFFFILTVSGYGQTLSEVGFDGHRFSDDKQECVSPDEVRTLRLLEEENVLRLREEGKLIISSREEMSLIWPVQASDDCPHASVYGISNYVDHNSSSSGNSTTIQDYNCGRRSYDLASGYDHNGTDVFLYPFPWEIMENDWAEVVAAAGGTIIAKVDNRPDKSCSFDVSTGWNVSTIQHTDGSRTVYGHLKTNSLTNKNVGDSVEQGEFLGIVGSSGISSGPHLHLEVYDPEGSLIDPYEGSCNDLNNESWWKEQKAYYDSKVNAIMTQSAAPVIGSCYNDVPNSFEKTEFFFGQKVFLDTFFEPRALQLELLVLEHRVWRKRTARRVDISCDL